jgi:hypothetical protein
VGRSSRANALDEEAVFLVVAAHIRHVQTHYDDLLEMAKIGAKPVASSPIRCALFSTTGNGPDKHPEAGRTVAQVRATWLWALALSRLVTTQ